MEGWQQIAKRGEAMKDEVVEKRGQVGGWKLIKEEKEIKEAQQREKERAREGRRGGRLGARATINSTEEWKRWMRRWLRYGRAK